MFDDSVAGKLTEKIMVHFWGKLETPEYNRAWEHVNRVLREHFAQSMATIPRGE